MRILIATLSLLISSAAFAQFGDIFGHRDEEIRWPGNGGTQRLVISCSSDDRQTRVCPVGGEILDVRLVRQISNAACIQGQTFYNDRQNVIVTRGCRGEFEVLVQQNYGGSDSVFCESKDYKYNTCYVGRYVRDIYLERQESNSPCREGQSWGFDRDRIWVDKGCRGFFRVIR